MRRAGLKPSRWLVVTLGILSAFGPVSIDMYLPAFPRITQDLQTSAGAVQLTLSVFLMGFAVGQLLWGTLSDHIGRRLPLVAGCLAFALASAAASHAHTITSLIVWRFVMGLSGSAGVVVSRAVVRDLFDETASARFYSMMMIIGGVAPIVAPSLGGLVLRYADWRVIFWCIALFGAICTAAAAIDVPETLPRESRIRGHLVEIAVRYARLAMNPRYIGYAFVAGLTFGELFAYISSASFVFIQVHGVSPQHFGLYFGSNAIGLYCMGQMNRWLLRRFTSRQVLRRASQANAALTLVLLAVVLTGFGGFAGLFSVLFLCVASLGLIFPNVVAAAMQPVPHEAGCASALLGMLQFTIGAAAGGLIGLSQNGTAVPMATGIAGFSLCSLAVLCCFAGRSRS